MRAVILSIKSSEIIRGVRDKTSTDAAGADRASAPARTKS